VTGPEHQGPALLAAALELAATAHSGLADKAGAPYLAHAMRVAARLVAEGDHAVAVGLLHDVVEDSTFTLDDLRAAGIPPAVCAAVDALTKRPGESYEQAIRRAAADPTAAKVKAADIADNADPSRLALLEPATAERLASKYEGAQQLLKRLTSADDALESTPSETDQL
jgi:(p)ppGpp synthase/HD superfamily hydrolase